MGLIYAGVSHPDETLIDPPRSSGSVPSVMVKAVTDQASGCTGLDTVHTRRKENEVQKLLTVLAVTMVFCGLTPADAQALEICLAAERDGTTIMAWLAVITNPVALPSGDVYFVLHGRNLVSNDPVVGSGFIPADRSHARLGLEQSPGSSAVNVGGTVDPNTSEGPGNLIEVSVSQGDGLVDGGPVTLRVISCP